MRVKQPEKYAEMPFCFGVALVCSGPGILQGRVLKYSRPFPESIPAAAVGLTCMDRNGRMPGAGNNVWGWP